MGYLNMPEKTEEALDSEGWLHSGDLGKQDQNGFLFITGRIKGVVSIFLQYNFLVWNLLLTPLFLFGL